MSVAYNGCNSESPLNFKKLVLSHAQVDSIVAHAVEGLPNEVCGLLAGKKNHVFDLTFDGTLDLVLDVIPVKNLKPSPVGYFMDPSEQIKAIRMMRNKGLSQVGIYHSHLVSSAIPSAKDLELAYYPDSAYVIVSLAGSHPELKAFEINKGLVKERPIIVS